MMNKYELTFLLKNEEDVKKISEIIKALSIKVVEENKWGKKNLAYNIKKLSSVFFYNFVLEIDQKQVAELNKKLQYSEELVRYLLLKID